MQPRPLLEEAEQGPIERRLIGEGHQIDLLLAAGPAVLLPPRLHSPAILLGEDLGLGDHLLAALEVHEPELFLEREGPLGLIEDLEDDHFVLPVAEVLQPL